MLFLTPRLFIQTGELDDFSFESYLGFPGEKEAFPAATPHSLMEARLGLQRGPPPSRPGL